MKSLVAYLIRFIQSVAIVAPSGDPAQYMRIACLWLGCCATLSACLLTGRQFTKGRMNEETKKLKRRGKRGQKKWLNARKQKQTDEKTTEFVHELNIECEFRMSIKVHKTCLIRLIGHRWVQSHSCLFPHFPLVRLNPQQQNLNFLWRLKPQTKQIFPSVRNLTLWPLYWLHFGSVVDKANLCTDLQRQKPDVYWLIT